VNSSPSSAYSRHADTFARSTNISFGDVVVGNVKSQTISLTNVGTERVTIPQINASGTAFGVSGITTPMVIDVSQTVSVTATVLAQNSLKITFLPFRPGKMGVIAHDLWALRAAGFQPVLLAYDLPKH